MEFAGIILSIRPEFVDAIFAGLKRFELRRKRPGIDPGAVVFVYCTAPRQAIVGQFTCRAIHAETPYKLWMTFGAFSAVSKKRFSAYFKGVEIGYALEIDEAKAWLEPISLEAIRRITPRFWPPQFHRRISPDEPLVRWLHAANRGSRTPELRGQQDGQRAAAGRS